MKHCEKRTRIPLVMWLLAGVGLAALFVIAMRYAIVPLLVMLGGMV
ncbi:MAG: hypothetical protein IJ507_04650 [Clostridia bacterium]|nr:hypothetical protein [Clostridia bacterium]